MTTQTLPRTTEWVRPAVETPTATREHGTVPHGVAFWLTAFGFAVPMLGGSLPTSTFEPVLNVPLVVLPIANHDNNQHAANENLRLQNLWDGIELFAAVLARLGHEWKESTVP